ncbi:hypothetical protein Tco_1316419 [Tanacetum coccineum]
MNPTKIVGFIKGMKSQRMKEIERVHDRHRIAKILPQLVVFCFIIIVVVVVVVVAVVVAINVDVAVAATVAATIQPPQKYNHHETIATTKLPSPPLPLYNHHKNKQPQLCGFLL